MHRQRALSQFGIKLDYNCIQCPASPRADIASYTYQDGAELGDWFNIQGYEPNYVYMNLAMSMWTDVEELKPLITIS